MPHVYVGHPAASYPGDIASLVAALALGAAPAQGWTIRTKTYENSSFDVRDFRSWVLQSPGPVILLRPVQQRAADDLRLDLQARVPVYVTDVYEATALAAQINAAIAAFEAGEPQMPRESIVALLLLRKLDQERMWAGNAKGYMWTDDIRKGRGIDEKYGPSVGTVLNVLLQNGMLVYKTSKSTRKYALNPDRREEIYGFLRARRLPEAIERSLGRGAELESIRALDILSEYSFDPRTAGA